MKHTASTKKAIRDMDAKALISFTADIPTKIKEKTLTQEDFDNWIEAQKQYFQLTSKPLILCFNQ